MKQSYIYKFIFLCNIFASTSSLYASNIHNYAQYHPSWDIEKFNFNHCQTISIIIDGSSKIIALPYHSYDTLTCNQGTTVTFTPQQSSILFDLYSKSTPKVGIYASLYKVVNNEKQFVKNLRFDGKSVLNDLEVNILHEMVLFQTQSQNAEFATLIATYDIPIMTFNGPYVQVDTNQYTVPELVTDVLIDNECVQVSNVTWASGNASNPSIGYFDGNNSIFPFEDGIILSTGYAASANGPKGATQSNPNGLGSDPDLVNILAQQGVNGGLNNATKLEFDFIPVSNQISFNFIFASEEYGGFQCSHSDVFAFILTDLVTGISTNLAVVPNTNIPVSVTTIRDQAHNVGCASVNAEYFSNFYPVGNQTAPINFLGHTVSLTAQSPVVPGNAYHIKLAIADYLDSGWDSAVFIEGGSFDIGSVDLGDDLLEENDTALCYNDDILLQSGLDPDLFAIQWYFNGNIIPGANLPDYLASQSGTYKIEAEFIGTDCSISDEIIVEIYPKLTNILTQPADIEICSEDSDFVDLTIVEPGVLNVNLPTDFDFIYYNTLSDLQNNVNAIPNPTAYNRSLGTTIYMRLISTKTSCEDYYKFNIVIKPQPDVTEIPDVIICNNYKLPAINSDEKYFSGPNETGTQYNAGDILPVGNYTMYIYRNWDGCDAESSFSIQVFPCDIPQGISPNADGLNDAFDLTYFGVLDIKIYNRYGEEVYSAGLGYKKEWIGQSNNGSALPDGTYYYSILTMLDRYEGWVQVNR